MSAQFCGQLFTAGLALTLGQNLIHCCSLCNSIHPFLLELEKSELDRSSQVYEKIQVDKLLQENLL